MKAGWQKWRELGPVIADKKIPTKLKTKLYTTVVRPVILYGAECWTTWVKEENILEKTEMRMLRRIKGVTVKDKMKSEDIRKELGVGSIKSKARESRLRWFGHVHRREGDQEADPQGDGAILWTGTCGNCGWCQKMQTTETFGDDGSGPLTPPRDKAQEVKWSDVYRPCKMRSGAFPTYPWKISILRERFWSKCNEKYIKSIYRLQWNPDKVNTSGP